MEYLLLCGGLVLALPAYYVKSLRVYLGGAAMVLYGLGVGTYFAHHSGILGLFSVVFGTAQVFNIARLVINRLHAKHLKYAFFLGGGRILAMQALCMIGEALVSRYNLGTYLSASLVGVQLLAALAVLSLTIWRLVKSQPRGVQNYLSDNELPSISVLVPARNEDEYLVELLKELVANDYPKMEIIVLDDCSTTSRIPDIVKQFAQDGVRFVQGDVPKDDWLAKNQAYDTLASSASGDWLIFMGVDVRLGIGSVRSLMNYALSHDKKMLSILPHRHGGAFWAGFFTPLRYFKEMLKIGILRFNVPALSTVWLIERLSFEKLGGMPSVSRKVIPEHYFANHLAKAKSYGFVRTNDYLRIASAKSLKEQINTSLRTLYPGLHRRLEWVAVVSLAMGVLFLAPFVSLVYASLYGSDLLPVYIATVSLLTASHLLVITYTNPILWPLALVNFPYLVAQEIALYVVSMYKYEFGEMYWKGRNICLPVMHVIPRLPSIPDSDGQP